VSKLAPLTRAELRAWVARHADTIDAAAVDNPFACAGWTLHFIDQVARDNWRFWRVAADNEPASSMLLYAEPGRLGDGRALTNYYASLFSPRLGGAEPVAMQPLARSLTAARPAFDTVNLAPMAERDADLVQEALRGCGWITRRYRCHGNWYLPCEGLGFEAYMAHRPSQLLNTWRRKAKAFKRAGGEARLQLITAPADVDAGMDAFETVFAKSWKQAEPYPRFVRDWAAICAARGWLRLGIAWVGDTPIAAQFWFTRNRRAYIFKLAYDEAQSKWSAGTVLSAMLFEHSLEVDRVVEIDYLTGDDAYKRSWMNDRRERVGVIACNPRTLRGLVRAGYESAGALRERWRARAASGTTDTRNVSPISSSE
jgi:hypothetical protein